MICRECNQPATHHRTGLCMECFFALLGSPYDADLKANDKWQKAKQAAK